MSQMIDFTLPSCQPGRTLHAFRCVPEGEVRAVLQLSHGMVEFIDRYKPLAENLAARGILVTGNETADGSQRLAECTHDQIHFVCYAEMIADTTSVTSEDLSLIHI